MTLCRRGELQTLRHQYLTAILDFTSAIEIDPTNLRAYFGRGVVYEEIEDHEKAMKDFDRVLELSPNYPAALVNRAVVYLNTGKPADAIVASTAAIKSDPKDWTAFDIRAQAYEKIGDANKAAADRKQVEVLKKKAKP